MSAVVQQKIQETETEPPIGGEMSFLDHLDELRKRIIKSVLFIGVAFFVTWYFSNYIFDFLSVPVNRALAEAQRREVQLTGGLTGEEKILALDNLTEGDTGRYIFFQRTKLGVSVIPVGVSVQTRVARDSEGKLGLFTEEPLFTENAIIPKGVRLPLDVTVKPTESRDEGKDRLIVTTAIEPFSLYVTVALYAAIALSVPFLLWQIWGFISPGLYAHERAYVTPFILLSSVSFVAGAAFAYYILFPPAARYLLGIGADFQLMLRATDYFDFITIIMLAMGLIFQMPAISYVLARIGLITAGLLLRTWKIALIVILIVAAVASPTPDAPNMMLFAMPMIVLYLVSILIAWIFGRKRETGLPT
jgi:sec-independent protein translocase protein TatC